MILSLDPALRCGWAAGKPGETPVWGVRHFIVRDGTGEFLTVFGHWLNARIDELKPDIVTYESPFIPFGWAAQKTTIETLRRLISLAGQIEATCWSRRVRCAETSPSEIMRFFLGTGRLKRDAKKAATIEMCQRYGWDVTDDNCADALSLWAFTEAILSPAAARERGCGPLFLKNDAPRKRTPAGRGSHVQQTGYHDAQQSEQFSGSTR